MLSTALRFPLFFVVMFGVFPKDCCHHELEHLFTTSVVLKQNFEANFQIFETKFESLN